MSHEQNNAEEMEVDVEVEDGYGMDYYDTDDGDDEEGFIGPGARHDSDSDDDGGDHDDDDDEEYAQGVRASRFCWFWLCRL